MRYWIYQLLTRFADWVRPTPVVTPLALVRPQIYAKGLWDKDATLPVTLTVSHFLQDIPWDVQDTANFSNFMIR
jgi:hypothetical protein